MAHLLNANAIRIHSLGRLPSSPAAMRFVSLLMAWFCDNRIGDGRTMDDSRIADG